MPVAPYRGVLFNYGNLGIRTQNNYQHLLPLNSIYNWLDNRHSSEPIN